MKKLIPTTKTFNSLSDIVEKTFETIFREVKSNSDLSSNITHISMGDNGLQRNLLIVLHKRSFQVIPKYNVLDKTVNLQTFEVVSDYNNIGNNKLVNVWGTDFIIDLNNQKEYTTEYSLGQEFFEVLIEGLYQDKK